ncbi:MAG TPA: ChaB family protein [Nitrososphaera sp.]|nr:ChaB family protein [Nitrososphaera sp.]
MIIDRLPSHAQKIYRKGSKMRSNSMQALQRYEEGCTRAKNELPPRVEWCAIKKEYKKKGDKWIPKKD